MLISYRLAYYGVWFLDQMAAIPRTGRSCVTRIDRLWSIAFVKAYLNTPDSLKKDGMHIGGI
jgi:hypothetical protein